MKVVKLSDVVEFSPEKLKKVSLFDTENFFLRTQGQWEGDSWIRGKSTWP